MLASRKLPCLKPISAHAHFLLFPLSIVFFSSAVGVSDQITTLGIIIDKYLTFDSHVFAVCKKSFSHLRALRHICSFLTEDMARSIATEIDLSRLNCANSLLFGCSASNMAKLQRVQNTAAHIVLDTHRPFPCSVICTHDCLFTSA